MAIDRHVAYDAIAVASLTMRNLSKEFMSNYRDDSLAAATQWLGAYQLEGLGIHLSATIEGAHTTILGLPMIPVLNFLRNAGYLAS